MAYDFRYKKALLVHYPKGQTNGFHVSESRWRVNFILIIYFTVSLPFFSDCFRVSNDYPKAVEISRNKVNLLRNNLNYYSIEPSYLVNLFSQIRVMFILQFQPLLQTNQSKTRFLCEIVLFLAAV